jgi:hypothetical protein
MYIKKGIVRLMPVQCYIKKQKYQNYISLGNSSPVNAG